MPTKPSSSYGRRALIVACAVHLLGLIALAGPVDLFNNLPWRNYDYAYHFYSVQKAHEYMQQGGRLWGYDPTFAAGMVQNIFFSVSNRSMEMGAHLLAPLGLMRAAKLVWFVVLGLFPLMLHALGRATRLDERSQTLLLALGLLAWWSDTRLMYGVVVGMYGFFGALGLALGLLALMIELLRRPTKGKWLLLYLLGPWVFWVHPFMGPVLLLTGLTMAVCLLRLRNWNALALWLLWAPWTLLCNAMWLLDHLRLLQHQWYGDALFWLGNVQTFWEDFLLIPLHQWFGFVSLSWIWGDGGLSALAFHEPIDIHHGWPRGLFLWRFAVLLGIWNLMARHRRGKWDAGDTLMVATACAAFYLSYFHGTLGLYGETYRNAPLLGFALLPAAVRSVSGGIEILRCRPRWKYPVARVAAVTCGPLLLLEVLRLVMLYGGFATRDELMETRPRPQTVELIDWLSKHTSNATRIGFEDGAEQDGLPVLLPLSLKRDLIGGPVDTNPSTFGFASIRTPFYLRWFDSWWQPVFGTRIETFSDMELHAWLQAYNIGMLCAVSPELQHAIAARPALFGAPNRSGEVECRHTSIAPNWFLEGSGIWERTERGVLIRNASPGGITVSLHYLATLRTEPPLPIEPIAVLSDPEPMMHIANGNVREFEIVNRWQWEPDPLEEWLAGQRPLARLTPHGLPHPQTRRRLVLEDLVPTPNFAPNTPSGP